MIESKRSKSKDVVSYDDLPDLLLVEILCRLPSKEFVFQCKCVSKHWLNLISDPYFIGRFLHLHRFHKQTPIARTLMDRRGEEFPTPRTTKSSSNLLDRLFERLMTFHGLEKKPYVVGTSNDLVLCCRTEYCENQREFYICNPCTRQWVALPPTTRYCTHVPVGFISDRYYEDEDSTTSGTVNIKKDYRCKVVRILPRDLAITSLNGDAQCKFIVEVFCFETGEWRESIASSPRNIWFANFIGVAYNGMLYWPYIAYEPLHLGPGITRLDPFAIGNGSASGGRSYGDEKVDEDHYQFHLTDAVDEGEHPFLCVRRGRLQMWATTWLQEIFVWELTGDDDHDHLGSPDKFYLKKASVFSIDNEVVLLDGYNTGVYLLAPDPNDEDIFHVQSYEMVTGYFKLDIRTESWSEVNCTSHFKHWWHWWDGDLYQLVLPWWPTPLRRLPVVEESFEVNDFPGKSRKLLES